MIKKTYRQAKEAARAFAIEKQRALHESAPSYDEIADVQNVLRAMGRRFGLLREFKENGIC